MSEKRKSTPNAKVLTALLIILFVGSCVCLVIALCSENYSRDKNTNPTETTVSTPALTETEALATKPSSEVSSTTAIEADTTENFESDVVLKSSYKIDSAFDEEGNSISLTVAFGSQFKEGNVTFEDGRFFINLPVQGKPDAYGGTYKLVSQSELELRYDNSDITAAKVIATDDAGVITTLDVTMSGGLVIRCTLP